LLHRRQGAETPAELYGHVEIVGNPRDMLEIDRSSGARPVQIDDMKRTRSGGNPAPGRLERIVVIHGLGVELPAREPNGPALQDVDRRQKDHAAAAAERGCTGARSPQKATKLRSIRSPCAPDFSGWNCTPKTLSRSTIVANR
jgi:hypothetical protein